MNIIAPPAGALLIGVMQLHWVLSIDILTAALAVIPLFFIQIPQPARVLDSTGKPMVGSILADIKEGFLYVFRWKGLFYVLLFAVLINFLIGPAFTLLPLLVTGHFKGDAIMYGSMESAIGIGIVIGGLGLGFSLKRVLEIIGQRGTAHVAELLPEVVSWNRELLGAVNGRLLDRPNVKVLVGDVFAIIRRSSATPYDSILLDVDNGPTSFVQSHNKRLYDRQGLKMIHNALTPGGRVAFWSAEPEPAFRHTLSRA
jgi:hypothetical protein